MYTWTTIEIIKVSVRNDLLVFYYLWNYDTFSLKEIKPRISVNIEIREEPPLSFFSAHQDLQKELSHGHELLNFFFSVLTA